MLTLDQLLKMTGPEIIAYNRERPGELDRIAEVCFMRAGWELKHVSFWDQTTRYYWRKIGDRDMKNYIPGPGFTPTTDANQTRKLVEAVPNPGIYDREWLRITGRHGDAHATWLTPLPLVTAAAVIAMDDGARIAGERSDA